MARPVASGRASVAGLVEHLPNASFTESPSVELRLAAQDRDLGRAQRALDAGADPDYTGGGPGYEGSTNALNNAA